MCQSGSILPCFQRMPVNRPVSLERPLITERPLCRPYVSPMLKLSDDEFPISLEVRAKRYRADMRKLGITTPDVMEP